MKLFKITCLFILLSLSAFAKDSTGVEFKRFAIGIHASPDYCYRSLSSIKYNTAWRDDFERPMLSYTGGVDLSYFIKKQFAVSLGVNYSQKGYKTSLITLTDANGQPMGDAIFRYNYNYIDVPVKANFIFGKKKIRFLASAGITSAFLLYQQTIGKYEYNDGSKETKKGLPNYIYNPFNLFLNGSVGIDVKLGKKMGLKIEPTYSYGLLQTISSPYSEHLYSFGLNVGWHIYF